MTTNNDEDQWVEYERTCNECGATCYHYDDKPYSLDRVIYCGKHCYMYDEKRTQNNLRGEGRGNC